ncbi:MAG: sigma-70 family RNA polymerase sigma factor [Patescibacteria group bacterium]
MPHADEKLLERAKKGGPGIAEVYDAYADKLYGFLLKRCGHKETAEDLVQRVFMKFIEALPRFEWRGVSLGAWLFRAASNALIDHWRSAAVRMDTDVDPETWDPPSNLPHPAEEVDISFERDKLAEAMKHMSPRDQQILDLRFFGGLEPQEIAAALDISPNHAAVLAYRAVGRLREKYQALYG